MKKEDYKLPNNPATDDYAVPPLQTTEPIATAKPQGLAFPKPGAATGSGPYSQVQRAGPQGAGTVCFPEQGPIGLQSNQKVLH